MEAVILHANGDEGVAGELTRLFPPGACLMAPIASVAGVQFGDQIVIIPVWSTRAFAQDLGAIVGRIAAQTGSRCIVARADGTPLPSLSPETHTAAWSGDSSGFESVLRLVRARLQPVTMVRVAPRRSVGVAGWAPGVGLGLAIYAGAFAGAGAYRSDEVNDAIATGEAVPLASALRSFQVAFDLPDAAPTATQVAVATPGAPTARFVEPQRVVVTATYDSTTLPIMAPTVAPAPLQDVESSTLVPIDEAEPVEQPVAEGAPLAQLTSGITLAVASVSVLDNASYVNGPADDLF